MINLLFLLAITLPVRPANYKLDDHAIYVSVVEIEQKADQDKGLVKVKVFADDLEDAIQNRTGERFNLTKDCVQNAMQASDYIKDHLILTVNGGDVNYRLVGCENVDISIWLEFEFEPIANWQELKIKGDYLMELFPTQSNVISVHYEDQKRMFRLTNSKKAEVVKFGD